MRTNYEINLLEIRQTLKEELQRVQKKTLLPLQTIKKLKKDLKTAEELLLRVRKHTEII